MNATIRRCSQRELIAMFGGARLRPALHPDERGAELVVLLTFQGGRLALIREGDVWRVRELPERADDRAANVGSAR